MSNPVVIEISIDQIRTSNFVELVKSCKMHFLGFSLKREKTAKVDHGFEGTVSQ